MLDLLIRRFNHPDFTTLMDMGLLQGKVVYLQPSNETPPPAAKVIEREALISGFTPPFKAASS